MVDDRNWDFHLRTLTASTRDSNFASDPSADANLLESVRKLHEVCKAEKSEDLVARVYPPINKLFQRAVTSIAQSRSSIGILLMAILQFFLDFGEIVLHDADPSLRTFFKSCLSREFADPVIAEATIQFLIANKKKLVTSFPALLPQFYPLLLKLIAWNGEKLERAFLKIFPTLVSPGSFLPLFPSVVDLPILVVALERVERSSGSLIGGSIASIQKSTAPEMLLALMDEAYTGSTIADGGGDSESEDSSTIDVADPTFLDLLKDENDGIAGRHWTSPGMTAALQVAAANGTQSDRLKESLKMAPHLLEVYFAIALRDVNDSLICALIPLIMSRNSTLFPDRIFCYEIRKRFLEFMLAAFQRSPDFVALLKKPIMDRLGEAYDGPEKLELALQLCWAIGEHGGGGESHKDAARELFESMELLLYENLSSSRLGLRQDSSLSSSGPVSQKSSQSRLLCFVVTAIAKLATYHRELLPRARVSLAKDTKSTDDDGRDAAADSLAKMKAAEEALEAKKQKPSFEYSGKLAEETNRVKGVTLLFNEPPDARKPNIRWRLYVFKGGEALNEPLYVHRQSCYLFGRERRVPDIPTDHPSCSKQHAVLQYRQVETEKPDGSMSKQIRPYIMDLGSTNKTSVNDNPIEPQRYYELFEKDTIKFGNSSREYVLLHENSLS